MQWRRLLLVAAWTVVVQRPNGVNGCLSGIFAQSLPRTVTWPSTPTIVDPSNQVVAFLFNPPTFLDRWSKADFSLLDASLSMPCSVLPNQPEVVILPEAWIEFLPALEAGARQTASRQQIETAFDMCDLFAASNVSQDLIPGCQDWSRIEAWKRLRIFYDIPSPISAVDPSTAYQRQCHNTTTSDSDSDSDVISNVTWTISVSTLLNRWMADRSPWTRPNATMPIVIVSRRSVSGQNRPILVQAELQLTYWMDSKLVYLRLIVCSRHFEEGIQVYAIDNLWKSILVFVASVSRLIAMKQPRGANQD